MHEFSLSLKIGLSVPLACSIRPSQNIHHRHHNRISISGGKFNSQPAVLVTTRRGGHDGLRRQFVTCSRFSFNGVRCRILLFRFVLCLSVPDSPQTVVFEDENIYGLTTNNYNVRPGRELSESRGMASLRPVVVCRSSLC